MYRSTARFFCVVIVLISVVGCGAHRDKPGSIASLLQATQHGLEVDQTVDDQARSAVLEAPTSFVVSFDDERLAWERARFFFEHYVRKGAAGAPVVSRVVGTRWSLTNGDEGPFIYEVSKVSVSQGFRYTVKCAPQGGRPNSASALNAGNLARFIREGKLELSLLPK